MLWFARAGGGPPIATGLFQLEGAGTGMALGAGAAELLTAGGFAAGEVAVAFGPTGWPLMLVICAPVTFNPAKSLPIQSNSSSIRAP